MAKNKISYKDDGLSFGNGDTLCVECAVQRCKYHRRLWELARVKVHCATGY